MSGDIVAFLTARWDEQRLRALDGIENAPSLTVHRSDGTTEQVREGVGYWQYVLDDLAAKRAILGVHYPDSGGWDGTEKRCQECGGYDLVAGYGARGYRLPWPCKTVRLLAAPFASHPDFDPAWRVEP